MSGSFQSHSAERIANRSGSLSAIKLGKSGRLAKLQSEHVRLCLNSLALKPGLLETDNSALTPSMASYVQKATEAAINTIQAHSDAVDEDDYLSYSVDVSFSVNLLHSDTRTDAAVYHHRSGTSSGLSRSSPF